MGRHNNRDKANNCDTDRQKDKELDKLRKELIKPKKPKNQYPQRKNKRLF